MTFIYARKGFKTFLLSFCVLLLVVFSIAFASKNSSAEEKLLPTNVDQSFVSSEKQKPINNSKQSNSLLINKKNSDNLLAGELDTTFGTGGTVVTPIGNSNDLGNGVAIQADGKIVIAGYSHNGSDNDFSVARYNSDGSLDTTFGTGGKVTTAIGNSDDLAFAVALQADEKIVVGGYSSNGTNNDFALVRYNTNGTLDTTFDTDGKVTTPFGTANDEGYGIAIQSNGKIVIAGYTQEGTNNLFALARYNADGSLDTTFDTDGKVSTSLNGNDFAFAVVLESNNFNSSQKIIAAGVSNNGTDFDFGVVRYHLDGSLDTSFSNDGKVTTSIGSGDDYATSLDIQFDGKIVVAGYTNVASGNNDFALVRYTADGSLDTSFDGDGKVVTAVSNSFDELYAVKSQTDGRIVVGGVSNNDFGLARYDADGSLDTTFDNDGLLTTSISSSTDLIRGLAIQSDGKIVAAGYSQSINQDNDFAIARYLNNSGDCNYSINPTREIIGIDNIGNGKVNVIAPEGCAWTAVSNDSWIVITSNNSGIGNGTVNYRVGPGNTFQDGTITIAGQTFNVIRGSCNLRVNPLRVDFPASGGSVNVRISQLALGCYYFNTYTHAFWIRILSLGHVETIDSVAYYNMTISAQPNYEGVRTGSASMVGGGGPTGGVHYVQVSQESGCSYSLDTTNADLTSQATTGDTGFMVGAGRPGNGCNWTATTDASWITITTDNTNGGGVVKYRVTENKTTSPRTGIITVTGQTSGDPIVQTFTIVQAPATLAVSNMNVNEGNSGTTNLDFIVTLNNASTQTVTVNYATANGTATAGEDYTATNGTLTFAAGQTSKTISVPVLGDTLIEPDETFTLNLSNATNSTIGNNQATGTIKNDDVGGTFQFSQAAYSVNENGGTATITVLRAGGAASNVSVNYATSNGTATVGQDYTAASGILTFDANETSKTFAVPILNDSSDEPAETVNLTLSNAVGGTIGTTSAILTINDDDDPPALSINNVSLNEGNSGTTAFNFTVSIPTASAFPITVNYLTNNGTATAGEDYTTTNGTLTFAAGETSKTIAVQVNGDTVVEPDETFTVILSNPTNATIAVSQGSGTIKNDDTGGGVQFSAANYTVNENAGSAIITVTRTGGAASGVTVNYATSNGTATSGQDYTPASGTLTFAANEMSKTFSVSIIDDSTSEPNETIDLTLSNAAGGGTLGTTRTAVLTIIDNDGAPTLSVDSISLNEGNSGTTAFTFTVSLLGSSSQTVSVNYSTADGSAKTPTDYQALSGSLSFAAGEATKTVTVFVNGDTTVEPDETFTLNLSSPTNATVSNGQGTGTIRNDDVDCSYAISPTSTNINAGGGTNNTISVTTQVGCAWSASNNASWITITSGGNGTGSGNVSFSVAANSSVARTGTISVAGKTFTVNQAAGSTTASRATPLDFDGDRKTDTSIFRSDVGQWWYRQSSTGQTGVTTFGTSSDKLVPADYSGDGKTDIAFWRPATGEWFVLRSDDFNFYALPFGQAGDIPAPGDYDGDGQADVAVYRPSQGVWYIRQSSGGINIVQFGLPEDKPTIADYDGDGKDDIAIYRPSVSQWWQVKSTGGVGAVQFGASGDKTQVGDYTGDGKADLAFFRPSNGFWYILKSDDSNFFAFPFGAGTDVPAAGDYDGDGKTDAAVFRRSNGIWYINGTQSGVQFIQFGATNDVILPNVYSAQ